MRDGDKSLYHGKSVFNAVKNVNDIIGPELIKSGLKVTEQKAIDDFMLKLDGTENKSKLGANAILGVSLAVCKAGAAELGIPLYRFVCHLAVWWLNSVSIDESIKVDSYHLMTYSRSTHWNVLDDVSSNFKEKLLAKCSIQGMLSIKGLISVHSNSPSLGLFFKLLPKVIYLCEKYFNFLKFN